jgi:hypothetical protein
LILVAKWLRTSLKYTPSVKRDILGKITYLTAVPPLCFVVIQALLRLYIHPPQYLSSFLNIFAKS